MTTDRQQRTSSRSFPPPVDTGSYPPANSPPNFSDAMGAPRPVGQQSSSGRSSTHSSNGEESPEVGRNPYGYSQPSLPRYSSGQSSASSTNYLPNPSPLNPTATRAGGGRDGMSTAPSRFSTYGYVGNNGGNNAHPLSNAMYMDSSPTLAGSDNMSPGDEKMRMDAGDRLGDYTGPRDTSPTNNAPYRRGQQATGFTAFYRSISGANIADSGKDERHVKLPRLGYLDGLKFFAAWLVLNGTFFDAVLTGSDYSFIQRNSPLYITRSTGLGITFLLLLSGRSLVTPLWDVPIPTNNGNGASNKTKSALISWARLTRAMLVRVFRFLLPVLAVVALQWGLASTGKTANCNAVGMDEPYWGMITNFAGFATLVFNLFTFYESDTLAGQTFSGNLWTVPWFFQSSYAVYVTHFMLGNLSSNRYWVYAILCFFSWTTYNYFYVAILGLILADMHAHGHLHRIRTKWPVYQRLALHASLITVALITQWVPVIRDNINFGMAFINVQDHPELTFCDSIFAFTWLLAIETSGVAQTILGNVVMRNLGKLAAGMYLLAPAITYTIVPDLALSLSNNGSSASSILGITWVVLFLVTFALAVPFHFLVELPSKMMGEVIAEILEGGNGNTRHGMRKSIDGKLLKRHPGGAANLGKTSSRQKPILV